MSVDAQLDQIRREFLSFVAGPEFVCLGAKSAMAGDRITTYVGRDIASAWNDVAIYQELSRFVREQAEDEKGFRSFVAIFPNSEDLSEREFEAALWSRLQSLSNKDALHGQQYDPAVSEDPDNPEFSLSFAGEGFFVVGLHPRASRAARRFAYPAMVFNMHRQFSDLRARNKYESMRKAILDRDLRFNGSVNPMLSRHGEASEAKQYSGRAVDEDWKCPFDHEQRKSYDAF